MNIDKLLAQIDAVKPGRFDCLLGDIIAIRDACGDSVVEACAKCFYYGFLKGQQAAEAEARKQAKAQVERHAPGYGMLITIIERNMGNERFIGALAGRAKNLEKLYCGEEATA